MFLFIIKLVKLFLLKFSALLSVLPGRKLINLGHLIVPKVEHNLLLQKLYFFPMYTKIKNILIVYLCHTYTGRNSIQVIISFYFKTSWVHVFIQSQTAV